MSAFEKLRQARSLNELAHEIEPFAQALVKLADDSRAAMAEQLENHQALVENWRERQTTAAQSWETTHAQAQATLRALQQQAYQLKELNQSFTLRQVAVAALVGFLSATVTTALWYWLPQWNQETERQQSLGAQLDARWKTLNREERAQLEKLMGWQ